MRAPRDGLHRRRVEAEFFHRSAGGVLQRPNEEFIVIPPGCKLVLVRAPLEAADLLLVASELVGVVSLEPNVPKIYYPVPTPAREYAPAPRQGSNPRRVPPHDPEPVPALDVVNLHRPRVRSHGQVLPPIGPADARHAVTGIAILPLWR